MEDPGSAIRRKHVEMVCSVAVRNSAVRPAMIIDQLEYLRAVSKHRQHGFAAAGGVNKEVLL